VNFDQVGARAGESRSCSPAPVLFQNVAHYVILAFVRTFQSETLRDSGVVSSTSSMVSMHASVTVP
jgi:hypothetical protein